ncbi:50S ribosomal protein L20 [Patescibacteria group bacterium]|nr:50S ribosomal protein L20 [Patescibacteria group bacterium]MBU1885870.1 50S ribosomal protein L20 [Patescibacteria group bacterium]
MPRTKTGFTRRRRHKKILKLTKGYRGTYNRLIKRAKEALLHADQYSYIGRKLRKRNFKKLWIIRINAGLKKIDADFKYSHFIAALNKTQIKINRKMLAELVVNHPEAFKAVVDKSGLKK